MSTSPASLVEVRRYIAEKTGVPKGNMGIRSARSSRGYHAGKSQIFGPNGQGNKDYSVKDPRNKAGLSEASSAIDIKLPVKTLKSLTAYLVSGAKAGTLDIMEVIGPDIDGKANYWSKTTGWLPKPTWASKDHEWHIHMGFPRDTEFTDRVAIFRPFFEGATPPPVEPENPDEGPSWTEFEELTAENEQLKSDLAEVMTELESEQAKSAEDVDDAKRIVERHNG